MDERKRLRVEYELAEVTRTKVSDRERELTRRYVEERFGVEIDDQVAESIVFTFMAPMDPCMLTFYGADGTSCRLNSAELRPLLE